MSTPFGVADYEGVPGGEGGRELGDVVFCELGRWEVRMATYECSKGGRWDI